MGSTSHHKTGSLGKPLVHDSAIKHVSGAAKYVADLDYPQNTLFGYVGLAPIACGKIKRLDLSSVQKAPGVVLVITQNDIPGKRDIGPVFPGDPLLADETILYYHQPIFALAAESYETARVAARLGVIETKESQPTIDIEDALKKEYFVRPSHTMRLNNFEATFKDSPHRLYGEQQVGGQEHFYLEGQVSLATPTEDGGMRLFVSTQNPTEIQKIVAEVLEISMNKITVETRRMGGGFGGKETGAAQWACLAAVMAQKSKRSVLFRLARADDMTITGKRHDFLNTYEAGFDDEGRLHAVKFSLAARCGFSPDLSDAIVDRAMFHADNAYYLSNAVVVGHRCKTDTVSNTAFRGFGGPQGMMAVEQLMDDIALTLNKDPLAIRKTNLYGVGERNLTPYHQEVDRLPLREIIEKLEKSSDYQTRRNAVFAFNRQNSLFKKGISLTPVKFGISFTVTHLNQASALIHVYSDGSVHLNHGGTEMGQGLFIKVAQVVADELGVTIDQIGISSTRTDKVPNTSATAASSGCDLNGFAAKKAAQIIKARLVEFASKHFVVPTSDIVLEGGHVHLGRRDISFGKLAQLAYHHRIPLSATGFYQTPKVFYNREKAQGNPFFYYAVGAAVSEVVIDTLTGENRVLRVDILHDVGQSINPAIDRGQIEGAFIQGMGWLTCEEVVWDKKGRYISGNPATYKIPATHDTPVIFNTQLLENTPNLEETIYHSKAVGEPPLMLAISVWSAIRWAVASCADYKLIPKLKAPATPENVLMAIDELLKRKKNS